MEGGFNAAFLHATMRECLAECPNGDVSRICAEFATQLEGLLSARTYTRPREDAVGGATQREREELQRLESAYEAALARVTHLRTAIPDAAASELDQQLQTLTDAFHQTPVREGDGARDDASETHRHDALAASLLELHTRLHETSLLKSVSEYRRLETPFSYSVKLKSAKTSLEDMISAVGSDHDLASPRTPRTSSRTTLQPTPASLKLQRVLAAHKTDEMNIDSD